MVGHFIGSHELDGVLAILPGHGVAAGVRDVLVGIIAECLQEIELRVMGIVFDLKQGTIIKAC